MERNHMLAPTRDRESASAYDAVLGPPPPLPARHLMGISPPAYSASNSGAASALRLPDVPTTELPPPPLPSLPPLSHRDHDVKLPSLSSLTGDLALNPPNTHWPHMNPLPPYQPSPPHLPQSADSPLKMDLDASSNSVVSAASPDHLTDARASSVSLDDPDVRLAAEALGDLRADFVSSPPNRNSSLPVSPPTSHGFQTARTRPQSPQHEPLLSLLTTSHPLLASTIEGATSAYGGAKNFSPRFRSGAEYVEGYLTPIANTVGSVGRRTGVEGGVRWFLGAGRRHNSSSSDLEAAAGSKKRRKVDNGGPVSNKRVEGEGMKQISGIQQLPGEVETQQDPFSPSSKARRMSTTSTIDTLPAYDEMRSPAYTETADAQNSPRPTSSSSGAWQSRLIMSTSGLSIAMSDESLRSLKYCLRWLRWANGHIGRVIGALKDTLEQFDREAVAAAQELQKDGALTEAGNGTIDDGQDQSRREMAARIASLKGDVLRTLQEVITTVSKYAGGALPDNARILVRRHLTSLPQRFRVATMAENANQANDKDSEGALREGAQKVLVLAKEGLDMVAQVSGVLDGTIVSAEEWCERMGKRRTNQDEEKEVLPQTEANGDVKMG